MSGLEKTTIQKSRKRKRQTQTNKTAKETKSIPAASVNHLAIFKNHEWRRDRKLPVLFKLNCMSQVELGLFLSCREEVLREYLATIPEHAWNRREVNQRQIMQVLLQAVRTASLLTVDEIYDLYLEQFPWIASVKEDHDALLERKRNQQWADHLNLLHSWFLALRTIPIFTRSQGTWTEHEAIFVPEAKITRKRKPSHKHRLFFHFEVPSLHTYFSLFVDRTYAKNGSQEQMTRMVAEQKRVMLGVHPRKDQKVRIALEYTQVPNSNSISWTPLRNHCWFSMETFKDIAMLISLVKESLLSTNMGMIKDLVDLTLGFIDKNELMFPEEKGWRSAARIEIVLTRKANLTQI